MPSEFFGYFMRLHSVDLSRYLPPWLNNGTFGETLSVLSQEHESYRLKLVDFAKQFFIETTTWAINDWLDFVGLKTSGDLETDRAAVKAKLLGAEVMTVANSNRLINYFSTGHVEESSEPNVLNIILKNPRALPELERALLELMPAHLLMKMKILRELDAGFFVGGAARARGRIRIDEEQRNPAFGAAVYQHGRIRIGVQKQPPFFGAAVYQHGRISIKPFRQTIPDGDKLRLHFHFLSYDKYITLQNPRSGITVPEIEEIGYYAAANELLENGIGEPIKGICKVEVFEDDEVTTIHL